MFGCLKFEATFKLDIKFKIVAKMCEFMLFITMQTWYMDDTSKNILHLLSTLPNKNKNNNFIHL